MTNINKILDAYEVKVNDLAYQVRSENPVASFLEIIDEINKHFNKVEYTFFSAYNDFLVIKSNLVSKDALQKYKRLGALLKEFEKAKGLTLTFANITLLFFLINFIHF